MDIVSSDDHDDIDDLDEDQDISFITSEHVTLTEELQENQEKAVKVKELKRYKSSRQTLPLIFTGFWGIYTDIWTPAHILFDFPSG